LARSPYSPAFERYWLGLNMRLPFIGVRACVEQFHR
jgi:hypothetical protein